MDVIGDKKTSKLSEKFSCKICDFKCCKKGDFTRHINTLKHTKTCLANALGDTSDHKNITPTYICRHCNKQYESRNGLWKHNKLCKITNINENINKEPTDKELIMMIIKDNSEFKNMMIEQQKYMMNILDKGTHNITNSNNNNKTFNLQVFLNETCKDAINLTDFVNQLQVSINDLEETGKLGYAEGISKVFIKNLNGIDFTKRPIHCCDSKRDIIYIKDDEQWRKDDEQKTNLTKAIKQVANKNIKQITEWQKLHPDYSNSSSKQNDKYMKIILNSMSGSTKEESDINYAKIAKNISKEVVINKT